MAKTGNVAVG